MRLAPCLLLALVAACSSRPSASDCEKATDHMIDIFAIPRIPDGKGIPNELIQATEAWKKGLKEKDPVRAGLIDTCEHHMTDSHIPCILGANDELALVKCFGG